jgi:Xaa-Pro dipeptidase
MGRNIKTIEQANPTALNPYQNRRERIYSLMIAEGIDMVLFEDTEGRRDPTLRWLTGHPGDGLLFLSAAQGALLVPWDINLAGQRAQADLILPYTNFDRKSEKAFAAAADIFRLHSNARVEIPDVTPYPLFLSYLDTLMNLDLLCRDDGIHSAARSLRAVKDQTEIHCLRAAAEVTNRLIEALEQRLGTGALKTELEAALFIEAQSRNMGCEGTGFETLAAGPDRSFGIHAFPSYTGGGFATSGMSILDFGVKVEGYTSDVTLTITRGPLTAAQERMLRLTEGAYNLALSVVREGTANREGEALEAKKVAQAVDAHFRKARKTMPHALGHGIGLEAHEAPLLRSRPDNPWLLVPGMVFTLEPGLYDPAHGGCRLENDILITEDGVEVLTHARIIRM